MSHRAPATVTGAARVPGSGPIGPVAQIVRGIHLVNPAWKLGWMSGATPPTYKFTNRPADNEAIKQRGSLTICFGSEMSLDAAPTGRRGRQQSYGDAATQTCLSMKELFGLALRQTRGSSRACCDGSA